MNVAEMVIVVVTISQAVKEFLRSALNLNIVKAVSIVLVVLVSIGVVTYNYGTIGIPFELWTFMLTVLEVAVLAVGGKLAAGSIAKKVNSGK